MPNFALALCVRKFQEAKPSVREELRRLDISSLMYTIAGGGAEDSRSVGADRRKNRKCAVSPFLG
jgi:hypothetical protein